MGDGSGDRGLGLKVGELANDVAADDGGEFGMFAFLGAEGLAVGEGAFDVAEPNSLLEKKENVLTAYAEWSLGELLARLRGRKPGPIRADEARKFARAMPGGEIGALFARAVVGVVGGSKI